MPDLRETVEDDMTDLEITKACAEAMQIRKVCDVHSEVVWDVSAGGPFPHPIYDPLHDDAQAMALVKRFGLEIWRRLPPRCWNVAPMDYSIDWVIENDDLNRAICECVAKMQRKRHD